MRISISAGFSEGAKPSELIDFENAYTRHGLAKKGITKKSWEAAIASQVVDSNENVVARAASRVAACHLRPIGYTRDFTRDDELKSVNVGHLWSTELANHNFKYENPIYCGVSEA